MIRRAFVLLLLVAGTIWAEGPKYGGYDKNTQLEFENVYNDLRHAGVSDPLTLSGLIVSTITASSATFTNALISSAVVTNATINVSTATNLTATNFYLSGTYTGIALGKIKQVVSATSTTAFSTTQVTFQTSNLSASITPTSSSSKILVLASSYITNGTSGQITFATLARGGSNLAGTNGLSINSVAAASLNTPCTLLYYDSPATTSATTYAVQIRTTGGSTGTWAASSNDTQVMVLIEVGS